MRMVIGVGDGDVDVEAMRGGSLDVVATGILDGEARGILDAGAMGGGVACMRTMGRDLVRCTTSC